MTAKTTSLIRLQAQSPDEDWSFHLTTGLVVWWMGEATSLIRSVPPLRYPNMLRRCWSDVASRV